MSYIQIIKISMNIQYYNAMRKFNDNYEQFFIDGYNPYNNIFLQAL